MKYNDIPNTFFTTFDTLVVLNPDYLLEVTELSNYRIDNDFAYKNRLDKYELYFVDNFFVKSGDYYKISEKITNCIEFRHHNLLVDKYPENCDLIVCRNVMIYFTEEAKTIMYHNFRNSLSSNGVLFVGSTEQIILPHRYKLESVKTFFYKRSGQV